MTYREWMAARHLLAEEQIGTHLRAAENQKSADYARSAAMLRRYEPTTLE